MLTALHLLTALLLLVAVGIAILLRWNRAIARAVVTLGTLTVRVENYLMRLDDQIAENQERVMDAFDDIEQVIKEEQDLTAEVQDEVQAILAKLGSADGGLTAAQTAQVHSQLAGVRDKLQAIRDAAAQPAPVIALPTEDPVSVPDGSGDSSSPITGDGGGQLPL